ncbi:MAG: T9SS type A sorting domain-containing protein, partial [Sphingobacteriaceae bacterium]
NEVAGTLLDKYGRLIVLFTNGSTWLAEGNAFTGFTGGITQLASPSQMEGASGTLRGDMASCGVDPLGGPLPVSLLHFNATIQNGNALLTWATSFESNTDKVVIEKSTNLNSWTAIAVRTAAGNSTSLIHYSYTDNNISGTVYYRLKFVDIDGSSSYSDIKSVSNTSALKLIAYPNPTMGNLFVESNGSISNIKNLVITDAAGKNAPIAFKQVASNKIEVKTAALNAGIYYIKIYDAEGNSSVQKFIKN